MRRRRCREQILLINDDVTLVPNVELNLDDTRLHNRWRARSAIPPAANMSSTRAASFVAARAVNRGGEASSSSSSSSSSRVACPRATRRLGARVVALPTRTPARSTGASDGTIHPSSATDSSSSDPLSSPHRTRRAFLASAALASALRDFAALALVDASSDPPLPSRPPSGGATTLPAQLADALAPASTAGRLADDVLLRIPMRMQGGTYVVEYVIGETSVRGVLDTGSPFITMEARCGEYWGCLREADARPSGYEETYEIYGLQEDGVTKWVLGDVQFRGEGESRREAAVDASAVAAASTSSSSLVLSTGTDARIAANDGSSSGSFRPRRRFVFPEVLLGVTSDVTTRGGAAAGGTGNAPFVGLVKERQAWIRPTFLGQTDVVSFALDFDRDELTLSRRGLIPRDLRSGTLAMTDLRPLGSPVFHYAVLAEELWINGGRHRTAKPVYVVFDSGTTGVLVDRELFESSDFALGTFECHIKFRDEDGGRVVVGTSLRTCAGRCLFLALPVDVPWEGVPRDAHVIFAGLAFLFNQGTMTVDADDRRLRLGGRPGPADA